MIFPWAVLLIALGQAQGPNDRDVQLAALRKRLRFQREMEVIQPIVIVLGKPGKRRANLDVWTEVDWPVDPPAWEAFLRWTELHLPADWAAVLRAYVAQGDPEHPPPGEESFLPGTRPLVQMVIELEDELDEARTSIGTWAREHLEDPTSHVSRELERVRAVLPGVRLAETRHWPSFEDARYRIVFEPWMLYCLYEELGDAAYDRLGHDAPARLRAWQVESCRRWREEAHEGERLVASVWVPSRMEGHDYEMVEVQVWEKW